MGVFAARSGVERESGVHGVARGAGIAHVVAEEQAGSSGSFHLCECGSSCGDAVHHELSAEGFGVGVFPGGEL